MAQVSREQARKEEKMASRISLAIIALAAVVASGFFVSNTVKEDRYNKLVANVTEGSVVLPSGMYIPKDTNLENTVVAMIESPEYSKKEKKEIIEIMALQGIDTTVMVETYNNVTKGKLKVETVEKEEPKVDYNDGINDEYEYLTSTPVINFLESIGVPTDELVAENKEDKSESGLNMLGGKSAKSYRNLYEAEKAFGTRLGLFFYVGCLKNYEMVAAYTVGDEFLQCVYAVNQDGTGLRDGQDIESSDINTLTVKLSMTKKVDELKQVYNDYELYSSEELETVNKFTVDFYGTAEKINMIAFDMDNGRSYIIHTANGINIETARALVYELDDGLTYVNDIVYEEPTY